MSQKDTEDGTVVSSPLETIIQGCHGCMTCRTGQKGDRPQSQRILSSGSQPAPGSSPDLSYVRKDRRNGVPVFTPQGMKHSNSVKPSPKLIIEEETSSSQASAKGGRRGSVTGSLPWSSTTTTHRKTVPNEPEMHGVNQRAEKKKAEREARMQRRAQREEEDKNFFGLSGVIRKFLAGEPQGVGENRDVESTSDARSPRSEDLFDPILEEKPNTQLWSPRMEETRKATREKMMSEGNFWKCEFCHSDNGGDVDRCDICGRLRVSAGLHGRKNHIAGAPKKQNSVKEKSGMSSISPGSTKSKDLASATSPASSRKPRSSSSRGTPGSRASKTPSPESMWGPDSIPGGSRVGSRRPSAE